MGKKIAVAGAGHGGIIAAAHLAKNGYDVTVYEKKQRDELGYDWLDAIDPKVFDEVGLPHLEEDSFTRNGDMMFYNPNLSAPLLVESTGNGSAKLERKFIYDTIIKFAEDNGVKFVYGVYIIKPLMDGMRVIGIETIGDKIYADLVIDACGLNSPLRQNLPAACNIDRSYEYGDCFYAYRAYYNKLKDQPAPECDYEIYLVHMGEKGISWNVTEEDSVDVLIGKMEPFSVERREEILDEMRKHNPQIGTEVVRGGGDICQIPVTNPLPVMVCNGYAAVGDSAFMTLPMTGSGIVAAFRAGKILAETVIKDTEEEYSTKTLWEYNYRYMSHYGAAFATIGVLKNVLISLPTDGLDFLFDKQIITQADLDFGRAKSGSKNIGVADIMGRATRGLAKLPVLIKTAGGLSKGSNAKEVYKSIPKEYDEKAVLEWLERVKQAYIPTLR